MSDETIQEQSTKQPTSEAPIEGVAPETAQADQAPATIPDQDDPTPAEKPEWA